MAWGFLYSATTLQEHVLVSLQRVIFGLRSSRFRRRKSQISHGETVRETANMISFMADIIGIRDDMYIGKGNAYMHEVSESVQEGYKDGVLEQRPTLVNLQCDIDHPTQAMADALHLIHELVVLKTRKGKSCHDLGVFTILWKTIICSSRNCWSNDPFRMDVVLAHPEGYEIMPEVEEVAKKNAAEFGGNFTKTNSMAEAFKDADVVYPKAGHLLRQWKSELNYMAMVTKQN